MSWVTIIWSMTAAACLTMAAMQLLVWLQARQALANLCFSVMALGVAAIAGFELILMRCGSPEEFGRVLRWMHLPIWVVVVSLVVFVRQLFQAGRPWLAWTVCGVRTVALVLNFGDAPNLNFREITTLQRLPWWGGELVSVPVGITNPWTLVGQLSSLLLLAFLLDTLVTVWRRGQRRRALLLGGGMVAGVLVAAVQSALTVWGLLPTPYVLSLAFLGILTAMGYELSRDVLQAAQLARELQASEARVNLAAEAAELGLWEWDMVRDEVWVAAQGRARLGLEPSGRLNFARFLETVHLDDRADVLRAVNECRAGRDEYETEYRVVNPAGQSTWLAVRGRVEFAPGRRPVRMRGVSMDITRRRQAELQVRIQREELAHLSRVAMLGELSGSIAHELNQPLTAILSNAQAAQRFLASDHLDREELREILEDIVTDNRRAGEVIRRLRHLFKKGDVQRQRLDLNEVIRDGLKIVQSDLTSRGLELRIELSQGLPSVTGDRVQLQQVLLNLTANACRAMADSPPADRRLLVRTEPAAGEGVCVSVSDRGCGIPEADLVRIFDSFFTTRPEGMGLGLAVCRTIIGAHRGRLWAENNADRGATLRFTLPAAPEDHP